MITKKFRILHTDDDKLLLEVYKKTFEKEGFEVTSMSKLPKDFITEIITIKPNLIISDIIKPEIDGLELLKRIKTDNHTKDIPFIFLSNMSADENIAEAKKLGALEFFVKSKMTVLEVVKEIENLFVLLLV